MGDSLSGCAINLALGCSLAIETIFSNEKASWTIQAPSHNIMSLPVFLIRYLPKFLSGAKIISLSLEMLSITFTALLEVQTISLNALISAEQLI